MHARRGSARAGFDNRSRSMEVRVRFIHKMPPDDKKTSHYRRELGRKMTESAIPIVLAFATARGRRKGGEGSPVPPTVAGPESRRQGGVQGAEIGMAGGDALRAAEWLRLFPPRELWGWMR